ncbi:MAG: hypothetical protein HY301_19575 [Verrucomicrobia bacterium]|nr:hypothetical protein [Verrucomicrobiota bacterium]
MNSNDHWKNLSATAATRPERSGGPTSMPFGFDTRGLAKLRALRELPAETWFRIALRAIPVGAAVLMVCWLVVRPAQATPSEDAVQLAEAVVAEALSR